MTDFEATYLWLFAALLSFVIWRALADLLDRVWAGRRRFPRR